MSNPDRLDHIRMSSVFEKEIFAKVLEVTGVKALNDIPHDQFTAILRASDQIAAIAVEIKTRT